MMKKLLGIVLLATVVGVLPAGNVLAAGSDAGDDAQKKQLRDRTCTQTCDPEQDCDGNQIQQRPRTRLNWPGDEDELDLLLWLLGF
jgi:hypothetical protein